MVPGAVARGTLQLPDLDILASGSDVEWDVVPQMQVTLNTRQHIMLNAGVRTPLYYAEKRETKVIFYLLWDWFDGGLREGW